jgi:hypothetical protein
MRIEFPYNLSQPDPEADDFIRDHILPGTVLPEEQFAAWYRYMKQSLPFPFKAYMLVLDKIEAYKPVYLWKYWLQKQQII